MDHRTDFLQSHSQKDLDELYRRLGASSIPMGEYCGVAWSKSLPIGMVNWFWKGKIFEGLTVRNKIFGGKLVQGNVSFQINEIVIEYPQLNLQDRLREFSPTVLLGRMNLGKHIVNFTLTKEKS